MRRRPSSAIVKLTAPHPSKPMNKREPLTFTLPDELAHMILFCLIDDQNLITSCWWTERWTLLIKRDSPETLRDRKSMANAIQRWVDESPHLFSDHGIEHMRGQKETIEHSLIRTVGRLRECEERRLIWETDLLDHEL